jgi:hypothetical protein
VETQGIAYSLDNSKIWTKYSANPVLKTQESEIFVIRKYLEIKKDNNGSWFWLHRIEFISTNRKTLKNGNFNPNSEKIWAVTVAFGNALICFR